MSTVTDDNGVNRKEYYQRQHIPSVTFIMVSMEVVYFVLVIVLIGSHPVGVINCQVSYSPRKSLELLKYGSGIK